MMVIALATPLQMAQMQLLSNQLQMLSSVNFAGVARSQRATGKNQQVITGNLAAVTTGAQNASPTNVGPT